MDKKTHLAIEEYLKMIRQKYSGIEKAFLFGSYAKSRTDQDSDIDLALVFRNLDESERFDFQVQLMLLASKIDTRIEPHPFSAADFESGNPFIMEIKKTGTEVNLSNV